MAANALFPIVLCFSVLKSMVVRMGRLLKKDKYLLLFVISFLLTLQFDVCYSATYYMGEAGRDSYSTSQAQNRDTPWLTLRRALSSMSENDTLIILAGTYTGNDNVMSAYGTYAPDGSGEISDPNNGYTVIKAEVDGTVTFDGQNERMMFKFNGSGPFRHVIFQGLKWINSNSIGLQVYNFDHVKFIKCGVHTDATGNTHSFSISSSEYVLAEDCYAWGGGRYKFIAYLSDHIIFRRCVGRLDAVDTTMPIATFQSYCSQHVEWQNCIAIDNDSSAFWQNYSYLEGGFTIHETHNGEDTEYNYYRGCIVLNHDARGFTHNDSGIDNLHYENIIVWDTGDSAWAGNCGTNISINHITFGNASNYLGIDNSWGGNSNTFDVRNSIIYGYNVGLAGVNSSDYNCLFNNNTNYSGLSSGANDFSSNNSNEIDPLDGNPGNGTAPLKYIIKIEADSDLKGSAADDGDIGATVMTQIGVSGTLYGETGYNVDTGNPLWPFPYENQIQADMRTYNPGGADTDRPDGTRGFCAFGKQLNNSDDITLTSYIWEYLGNTIPPEIYDESEYPRCTINSPTNEAVYENGGLSIITLSGTASDDAGITQVTWENLANSVSGTADGTNNWTAADIALAEGDNEIVVTASDADGYSGEDRITVRHIPSANGSSGGCFVVTTADKF